MTGTAIRTLDDDQIGWPIKLFAATAVFALISTFIHWHALDGPFIFDDQPAVSNNSHIRQLWPPGEVVAAPPSGPTEGRPLVSYSFAVGYAIHGLDPRGFRIFNLAIHVLCAVTLMFCVTGTFAGSRYGNRFRKTRLPLAFCVALIWLVHPATSECVNYITQRTESMMTLFVLLAFAIWVRLDRLRNPVPLQLLAGICILLAALCKETAAIAPIVFVLWDIAHTRVHKGIALTRKAAGYAVMLISWLIVGITLMLGSRADTIGTAHGVGRLDYLFAQASIVLDYLIQMTGLGSLPIDYGMARPTPITAAIIPGAIVLILVIASIQVYLKRPKLGWPLLAAWLFLAPTSTLVPIVSEVGALRRIYLPLACVIAFAVPFVYLRFVEQTRGARNVGRAAGAVVLVVVVIFTMVNREHSSAYANAQSLWYEASIATPDNPRAQLLHALEIQKRQGTREALDWFKRAAELDPDWPDSHLHLGNAHRELGNDVYAMQAYAAAARANPDYAPALRAMANMQLQIGEGGNAIELFRRAVQVQPNHIGARERLGLLLLQAKQPAEALTHLQYVAEQKGDSPEAWNNLAVAYAMLGQKEQAIAACNRALAIDPNHRGATQNLQRLMAE